MFGKSRILDEKVGKIGKNRGLWGFFKGKSEFLVFWGIKSRVSGFLGYKKGGILKDFP